jgi:hypothetical protein
MSSDGELLSIDGVHAGDESAWNEWTARYEGRLLAYVESRLRRPLRRNLPVPAASRTRFAFMQ